MSDLPRLYLIRHGETAWSISGQHTGRSEIPLTPHGETMARDLAPILSAIPFAQILTSPRQRARDTCALATPNREAEIVPDLAEWDYGDYEGLASREIRQTRPGWSVFRDGCPNGESLEDVAARADRLLARLRGSKGPIALFSHGQFGCVLAARWMGLAPLAAEHFALDTASISLLGPKLGHPQIPALLRWNIVDAARTGYREGE